MMSSHSHDTETYIPGGDFGSRFFVPPPSPVSVKFGGTTHTGNVRTTNEDHFAVLHRYRSQHLLLTNLPDGSLPSFRNEAYAFVVADGMGGEAAGELASRLVLEEAWDLSSQASSWIMRFQDPSAQQVRERAEAYVTKMHEKLVAYSEEHPRTKGMGTTWTSAYVVGWQAILFHIGDSRAYLYRGGELCRLTRDHTLAQELVDRGVNPQKVQKLQHVLTNTLGRSRSGSLLDVEHLLLQNGDRLLLCTDGLTNQVPDEEIAEIIGGPDEPRVTCHALEQRALKHGGKDNITVVLAEFTEAS